MWRGRGRRRAWAKVLASLALVFAVIATIAPRAMAAGTGSISGQVTGPNGPLSGTTVVATPFNGPPGGVAATTAADGRYSIKGLAAGDYRVSFFDPAFGPAFYPGTTDFARAQPVTVNDGADTPNIDQHYTATGGISGRITDDGGAAVAGAIIDVTSTAGFAGASTTTAADGTYAATGLANGTYWVRATATGHEAKYDVNAVDLAGATAVTVAGGLVTTGIDIVTPRAGAIRGRVTNLDGTPAALATVIAITDPDNGQLALATTAPDGSYAIDNLPAGQYVVSFTAAGGTLPNEYYDDSPDRAHATDVAVIAGTTTSGIDAILGPDPSLGGTVRGVGDAPLPGATVTITPVGGTAISTTTGADGTYLFSRLADGDYTVVFSAPGYVTQQYVGPTGATTVHVVRHQPVLDVDARLHRPTSLEGTVSASDGPPIAGATVDVRDSGGAAVSVTTDVSGHYVADLPPGAYTVHFSAVGFLDQFYNGAATAAGATVVTLAEGEHATGIDARLHRLASLEGTVSAPDGSPIAGATVDVRDASGTVATLTTDATGHYVAANLPAGDYTVRFAAAGFLDQFYNGAATAAGATVVTLAEGGHATGIDAHLVIVTVNEPPVANDDHADVTEGFGPVTIDVLANDTDPNGDPLAIKDWTPAANGGTATCTTGECSYLPPTDAFVASDHFGYTVSDGDLTDDADVTVTVEPNAQTDEGGHRPHRVDLTAVLKSRDRDGGRVVIRYCIDAKRFHDDVEPRCQRAVIGPDTDRAALPVWVKGDNQHDGDTYVTVDLKVRGGTVWDDHLTLLIHDDDPLSPCHGRS